MSDENRRPIKARSVSIFQKFAAFLAKTNITPNQISVASVAFAMLVPFALWIFPFGSWVGVVLAILGIQLRLMCNLLDGMVAIEGAKKSVLGEIFNEFPDRVADTIIILGLSCSAIQSPTLCALSWCAAFFAVLTAYVRVLGASVGAKHYFIGPMAKQHRMALITFALLISPFMKRFFTAEFFISIVLSIIILGALFTVARRIFCIAAELQKTK